MYLINMIPESDSLSPTSYACDCSNQGRHRCLTSNDDLFRENFFALID